MTKLTKTEVEAVEMLQPLAFGMVKDATARDLIDKGYCYVASVQLNDEDAAKGKGCTPVALTEIGRSYGRVQIDAESAGGDDSPSDEPGTT